MSGVFVLNLDDHDGLIVVVVGNEAPHEVPVIGLVIFGAFLSVRESVWPGLIVLHRDNEDLGDRVDIFQLGSAHLDLRHGGLLKQRSETLWNEKDRGPEEAAQSVPGPGEDGPARLVMRSDRALQARSKDNSSSSKATDESDGRAA